jgi:hypothetical protein
LVLVTVVVGGLLISESYGFSSKTSILSVSSSLSSPTRTRTTATIHPLNLINANLIPEKRKWAQHGGALSHPKQFSPCDNILIPSSLRPNQQPYHDHITTLDKTFVIGFIGMFGAILYKFVTNSSPGSWRYFLSGGLCAASSHAIPTPIDVIKVGSQRSLLSLLWLEGNRDGIFLSHGIILRSLSDS